MKLIDILVRELPKRGGWPEGAEKATSHSHIPGVHFWDYDGLRVDYSDLTTRELGCEEVTREQYEAELAAKNEGWIEWGGGECPVADFLKVEYQLRGGAKGSEYAKILEWQHEGGRHDIIAYRLHQPQEADQAEAEQETDLNECIGQDAAPVWGGEGKPAIGEKCEHHSGGQWEAVTIAGIYENLVTGFTDYWMVKEDGSSYTVGNPYRFRPIRSEADRKRDIAAGKIFDVICKSLMDESESTSFAIYDAISAGEIPGVKLED